MSKWLLFKPHAGFEHTACEVDILLLHVLLYSFVLIWYAHPAAVPDTMHDWDTLSSCIQWEFHLDNSFFLFEHFYEDSSNQAIQWYSRSTQGHDDENGWLGQLLAWISVFVPL